MPRGRDANSRSGRRRKPRFVRPGKRVYTRDDFRPDRKRVSPAARIPRRAQLLLLLTAVGAMVVLVTLAGIIGSAFSSPLKPRLVSVTQTDAALGQRMQTLTSLRLKPARTAGRVDTIRIDPNQTEQTFWGVGGAITDSSAYLIEQLPKGVRTRLLERLYGSSGLGLSFGVVPIGASDFTALGRPYSYDDLKPGQVDPDLRHFSLNHDDKWDLPVLEQISDIQPKIKLFGATWTAPAWMKANDALNDLGFKGALLPKYYASFANYLVDWLKAYKADGVNIAAIAPENEPNSPSAFPSMYVSEAAEAEFIHYDLAPALSATSLSTTIFGGDVGLPRLDYQADLIAGPAGKDLGGLAWHCYSAPPTQLALAHTLDPSLIQVIAECASNLSKLPIQENVIGALANGASAYAAWNVALTASGGPVQKPNSGCGGCRGLLTVNPKSGGYSVSADAYVLGQVGHFVTPGAVRLATSDEPTFYANRQAAGPKAKKSVYGLNSNGILNVAYANPDGKLVLVTYNSTSTRQTIHVNDGTEQFTTTLPAGAMTTFSWNGTAPGTQLTTLLNSARQGASTVSSLRLTRAAPNS
jgi:glucosylceramidase